MESWPTDPVEQNWVYDEWGNSTASSAPFTFLCYAREDADVALALRDLLVAYGPEVWIDVANIEPGRRWHEATQSAIERCSHVVVLALAASARSDEVEAEWSLALTPGQAGYPRDHRRNTDPILARCPAAMTMSNMDTIAAQLRRVLPDTRSRAVLRASLEDGPVVIPNGYVMLRTARTWQSATLPDLDDRSVLAVRPASFPRMHVLLSELFLRHLSSVVPPYSYGERWILEFDRSGTPIVPASAQAAG